MQKSLYIARALARQGWRVVVVEEHGWGLLSPARFSRFVDAFHLVPSGGGKHYVDALVAIAEAEKAELFVPCSGAGTTHEDALAADKMRRQRTSAKSSDGFRAVIQDPELVLELHEKDKFITLTRSYSLDAPESILVDSPQELLKLLRLPKQPPRILKCAAELDDVGRSDLTLYPLRNKAGAPDFKATERRISSLPIPISKQTPYIAQEFIGGGRTTEWCTHSTIDEQGNVLAFVCCPSNDMLMTYHPLPSNHPLGQRALAWTREFMRRVKKDAKWQGRAIQGHYSFDFIHQPDADAGEGEQGAEYWNNGRLVAIECNPRVHTAVGLLAENPKFGSVYDLDVGRSKEQPALIEPLPRAKPMSWLAHDVPARLLPHLVPRFLRKLVHPLWLTSREAGSSSSQVVAGGGSHFDLAAPGERDAAWDQEDPLPFVVFYHVTWPYLVLRQVLVRRRAWSRINVSTARIFEC
ncbi:hypothetical protein BDZ90DRAFT_233157 [Jaminaea rosea]|uniref:ATP-grasp domain-containing protein n=1 Tax=Jaminaea rosea TaxID=1569628 RepID=A0A316UTW7_9BASI|nr:hypothetical protein BDZ90DRAFT_233157 [Jaminaea rosea]PWN26535.1 hypothetical protein BDZ90DRAFT_233157 [Jaminaea rosea]